MSGLENGFNPTTIFQIEHWQPTTCIGLWAFCQKIAL